MAKTETKITCTDYVEIDIDTAMVTVLSQTTIRGIFADKHSESSETYVLMIKDRVAIDSKGHAPAISELNYRIWEFAVSKLAEKRLDRFCSTL